jgi:hypothetical protein
MQNLNEQDLIFIHLALGAFAETSMGKMCTKLDNTIKKIDELLKEEMAKECNKI